MRENNECDVSNRYLSSGNVQTTTLLHHILYFEKSVHALFEMIDMRKYRHHEMNGQVSELPVT